MPLTTYRHRPVLSEEVLEALAPALGPDRVAVDCTVGGAGHTRGLLSTGAKVLGMDRDESALAAAREIVGEERLELVHCDFRFLEKVVRDRGLRLVHAVLADLGASSPQLDDPTRGFSFGRQGPLDMRMDRSEGKPLYALLDTVDEKELADVIRSYGEERRAKRIAKAILDARKRGELDDTVVLAGVISRIVGRQSGERDRTIHPATRTFQALRIWVNDELGSLESLLDALPRVLAIGGRAAIISFHSLEDRRVKQAFARLCQGCICPPDLPVCGCNRRPEFVPVKRRAIKASESEITLNPRARSARLRVVERIESRTEPMFDESEGSTHA